MVALSLFCFKTRKNHTKIAKREKQVWEDQNMKNSKMPSHVLRSVSVIAVATSLISNMSAYAQQAAAETEVEEIVVTGVRASLDRAIDVKRNSFGVVDAISAEDIGKFPDTNVAESMQRIPGISISRVNGEGSQITARGFGPGYNLVTLNGRQMPATSIPTVGGDQNSDYASGVGRAFDFGNLASEGISRLEVYKTGRASNASGGIGASINVVTRRPLDAKNPGFAGSIGAKAVYDTSESFSNLTPEFSGLASWSNDAQNIGLSIYGSYQKRKSTSVSATSNNWNVVTRDEFLSSNNVTPTTVFTNTPASNQLIAFPNDSRYHFSEFSRERINAQAVLQLKPTDSMEITADALFARNASVEQRADQANWFNKPFRTVRFDSDPTVATTVFLEDTISSAKDAGFEQQYRSGKAALESYGLNIKQELSDAFTLKLDGHVSKATSKPNSANDTTSTTVGLGTPTTAGHTVDYSGRVPLQVVTRFDDSRGNNNGRLDIPDVGSSIGRTISNSQTQNVKQGSAKLEWEFGDGVKFEFGADYINNKNTSTVNETVFTLGNWGLDFPGDVERVSPGTLEAFCLACKFENNPGLTGSSLVAFRGNAVELYDALTRSYGAAGNTLGTWRDDNNQVQEKTWAVFGQAAWKGELGSMSANMVAGVRYEQTKVKSTSIISVPEFIEWNSDNDFSLSLSDEKLPVSEEGKYSLFLPSVDFSIEPFDGLIARVSGSRTAARTGYSDLFANINAGSPSGPTFNGGFARGSQGTPGLKPLLSWNIDVSLEWYFAKSSYISVGFFDKRVKNFVGKGQFSKNLFGLRDVSSGAPGTRSGTAITAVRAIPGQTASDVNVFTMAALIQQTGSVASATALYNANLVGGVLNQGFIDSTLSAVDLRPDATDPLFNFSVEQPVNNRSEHVYGFELAAQYFLGDTGLGVAGSFTKVYSSAKINNGLNPKDPDAANQFALLGLSDTYNVTLIYDKHGISGRLAYNWRGTTLSEINRGPGVSASYVEPFATLDLNVSYDISDRIAVSFEGINLLSENLRTYGRTERQLNFYQELKPRYMLGARYKF
jgi:TonB-dependent receptor